MRKNLSFHVNTYTVSNNLEAVLSEYYVVPENIHTPLPRKALLL